MIRFLCAINQQTDGGVTIIAACDEGAMCDLHSLSALKVRLSKLTDEDSRSFATGLLAHNGINTVTDDGLTAIVGCSDGSPAQLTRICELVKVAAATNPNLQINENVLSVLTEETLVTVVNDLP